MENPHLRGNQLLDYSSPKLNVATVSVTGILRKPSTLVVFFNLIILGN